MLEYIIPGSVLAYSWREGHPGTPHRIYDVNLERGMTYIAEVTDIDYPEEDGMIFDYSMRLFRNGNWSPA